MYPILILREEIVCLIILGYLCLTARYYRMGKDRRSFSLILFYAIGHVVFDIVTVLTVNRLDTVPRDLNRILHVIFYLFALLFSRELFCYVARLCFPEKYQKYWRIWSFAAVAVVAVAMFFLRIDFLYVQGTKSSYGPAAFAGYGLAGAMFVADLVFIFVRFKYVRTSVKVALIPMLLALLATIVIQVLVPSFLFTGGAVTLVTVGIFFSMESPAEVFRQKMMMDAQTGVRNRNSFNMDREWMEKRFARDRSERFGFVFADLNNLKAVNDLHGHQEGDALIGIVADLMLQEFKGAEGIYRMGGDEFLAVFHGKTDEEILERVEGFRARCAEESGKRPYRVSVAVGYACSGEQFTSLSEVLRTADFLMYENKTEMKRRLAYLTADGKELNLSGLTDRVYKAFTVSRDRHSFMLCNLSTNVTRWSRGLVEYFDLPGEFIFNGMELLTDLVHPADRADFKRELVEVMTGSKEYQDAEVRIKNKKGEYVSCICQGTVIPGRDGEPDLYVGTLIRDREPGTGEKA